MALRLMLFGAPQLERDGTLLTIPRRKVLALLAYLAVTGQPHSRESLAALFWPGQDPSSALANLRRTLGVLKETVGEGVLLAERAQIGLDSGGDLRVDVGQFQAMLATARADGHFDHPTAPCPTCLSALLEAAGLYQGDFMAGFHLPENQAFEDWQYEQSQRLQSDLSSVLVLLARWQAQAGEFQSAVEHARRWLALDPLHEPAHRLLMKLYAWSDQPAAAARQFHELTRLLDEELGVDPEEESVRLHEAIQAGQLEPAPAETVAATTGSEPRDPDTERHRPVFPRALAPLIGRDEEVRKVLALLQQPDVQLVTIAGLGGMGKSHLALAAGEQIGRLDPAGFPDGAVYVPLAGVSQASELPGVLADALELMLQGGPDPMVEVCHFLSDKKMLLVLDNFEQLVEEAGALNRLLNCAPGVKLLVTSREPLALAAEWRFNLEGLTYPDLSRRIEAGSDDFESYGSVQLFLHAARQIRADMSLEDGTRACIARLCWLLSGNPLALNLAAAWLRVMSCAEIVRELEYNLDLLASQMRDLPARQQSIGVIIESTWEMLSPEEQQAFRSISVFQGGFSVQAVKAVSGATPLLLGGLVDKGLVQFVDGRRYMVHELVRQFAAEQLDLSGEGESVAEAHSGYYLGLVIAQQEKLNGQGAVEAIDTIRDDLANIRQAWVWAALNERLENLAGCYPVLASFFEYVGLLTEGESLFERTAALMAGMEDTAARRLKVLLTLRQFQFSLDRGQTQGFQARLEPVTAEVEDLQDESLTAELNFIRAYSHHLTGQFDRAIELYQQAIDTFRRQGRRRKLIDLYNWLGEVHSKKHMLAEAAEEYWRAYDLAVELGDQRRQALSLSFIGGHHWHMDEFLDARDYFRRALDLFEQIGDRLGTCRTLNNVGYLNNFLGNYEQARAEIHRAIRLFEQTGAYVTAAQAYDSLGETFLALGDFAAARREFQLAYDRMRANEQKYDEAFVLANLARVDAAEGEYLQAETKFREAIRMLEETGIHKEVAVVYGNLGALYRRMGQLQKADEAIRRSISGLQDVTGPYHLAKVSLEKAALLIDRHQPEDAGALIDAASRAAEQSGTRPLLVQAGLVRARQQAAAGQVDRAAETLRSILAAAATDLERGEVNFSLWELTGDRDGAQAAMQIYARLAENIRGGEVCRRLEALRAALGD